MATAQRLAARLVPLQQHTYVQLRSVNLHKFASCARQVAHMFCKQTACCALAQSLVTSSADMLLWLDSHADSLRYVPADMGWRRQGVEGGSDSAVAGFRAPTHQPLRSRPRGLRLRSLAAQSPPRCTGVLGRQRRAQASSALAHEHCSPAGGGCTDFAGALCCVVTYESRAVSCLSLARATAFLHLMQRAGSWLLSWTTWLLTRRSLTRLRDELQPASAAGASALVR